MHSKSIIMRPSGGFILGALKVVNDIQKLSSFFADKCDFESHFGRQLDFEGGPKIAFLVIMLEKNEENEVRERFREKHEILMDF